jgi:hypothetical protein
VPFAHFRRRGVFVNLLQEAGSQSVGHDESTANDTLGNLVIPCSSACIRADPLFIRVKIHIAVQSLAVGSAKEFNADKKGISSDARR